MTERRMVVIGCGNILMRDDGLGVRAIERLAGQGVPDGVELIDAGTALIDVLPELAGAGRGVLVDAIRAGGEPGAVYRLPLDELKQRIETQGTQCSLHDVELREAINIMRLENMGPAEIVVIAMEPAVVDMGMELSEPVERALPKLLDAVMAEVVGPKE